MAFKLQILLLLLAICSNAGFASNPQKSRENFQGFIDKVTELFNFASEHPAPITYAASETLLHCWHRNGRLSNTLSPYFLLVTLGGIGSLTEEIGCNTYIFLTGGLHSVWALFVIYVKNSTKLGRPTSGPRDIATLFFANVFTYLAISDPKKHISELLDTFFKDPFVTSLSSYAIKVHKESPSCQSKK